MGLTEKTTFCTDGQQTVDAFREELLNSDSEKPVTLILTDLQMPQKNGLQVVNEVRTFVKRVSDKTGRQIEPPKFVFLTAYVSQGLISHAKDLGISHIYEKPLHDSQMHEILLRTPT